MGRKPIIIDVVLVENLASQGHTEAEIARRLGFSRATLARRKRDSDTFDTALKRGQETAHSTVSNALFTQAQQGNLGAIVWYEKTRRGMKDTQDHSGDVTIRIVYDDGSHTPPA